MSDQIGGFSTPVWTLAASRIGRGSSCRERYFQRKEGSGLFGKKQFFLVSMVLLAAIIAVLLWQKGGSVQDAPAISAPDAPNNDSDIAQETKSKERTRRQLATRNPALIAQLGDEYETHPERSLALAMGFDIGDASSIASYFYQLEDEVKADGAGAMELARLYRVCSGYRQNALSTDESHPDYAFARECLMIPDRGQQYAAKVVAWGASHGDRDAILAQINHPPSEVTGLPDSDASRDWANAAFEQLASLANSGDREAQFQLGFNLMSNAYGGPNWTPRAPCCTRLRVMLTCTKPICISPRNAVSPRRSVPI